MGVLDKLFGAEESDKPNEKPGDGRAARAAEPSPLDPGKPAPVEPADARGTSALLPRDVDGLMSAVTQHIERSVRGFEQILEGVQTLTGMLQAVAKSAARSDQERKQQFLDLRAHLTTETDRLVSSMRDDVRREASIELFRAILPALDEVDHVLRESGAGAEVRAESVRIVRRRLRDALSRLGIEETPIVCRETTFDAELHEGRPYEGDAEAVADLAADVVVDVERNGWTGFGKVLRHALVTVVKE